MLGKYTDPLDTQVQVPMFGAYPSVQIRKPFQPMPSNVSSNMPTPSARPEATSTLRDRQLFSPAAERNSAAITGVLREILPAEGTVLEIGSGSGQHVTCFAKAFPGLSFQPTDPDSGSRDSILAWTQAEGLSNIKVPVNLDAAAPVWPVTTAHAILAINVIHISPWRTAQGLFRAAGIVLPHNGPLYLYGPFKREGKHTADSNQAFDRWLRERDPAWGVRDIEEVTALARETGFNGPEVLPMPANNFSLVFRRR